MTEPTGDAPVSGVSLTIQRLNREGIERYHNVAEELQLNPGKSTTTTTKKLTKLQRQLDAEITPHYQLTGDGKRNRMPAANAAANGAVRDLSLKFPLHPCTSNFLTFT